MRNDNQNRSASIPSGQILPSLSVVAFYRQFKLILSFLTEGLQGIKGKKYREILFYRPYVVLRNKLNAYKTPTYLIEVRARPN